MFMAKLDSGCVRWWTPLREVRGFRSLLLGCLRLGTGILGAQMIPEVFKMQKKNNHVMITIMIEQTTFLAGECGNTLNKPSGSTTRGSFSCLVLKVLSLDTKSEEEKM